MSTAYSSAKQKYIGNGVTTEWGFDFPIKKHSELKVYLKRSSLPQVLLEEGVDYSFVTENTIAFPIKTGEAKLQATDVLALQRESVFESEYNFSNQQRLEPEEVMHADDNLERQIQELKRDSESSIKVFPTSSVDPTTLVEHVERVYGSVDNIDTVANDKANVDAVAGSITNVNTVAGDIESVKTVANNIESVVIDSTNISHIKTVAGSIANVNKTAGSIDSVNAVAPSISSVNTVSANISSVNTAASNMAAIQYAPTAAANAANSATISANSAIWAEGTDAQVQALGGVHSSKGWAEQSSNANISLTNNPYTTNRILEIPQDIKLELNNGTLTLKAGSKVYVPNGFEADGTTQKFDSIPVASDLSVSSSWGVSGETFIYYKVYENELFIEHPNYNKGSGTTLVSDGTYYYTDSNYIRRMTNSSVSYTLSFPLAKITITSDNKVASIDQIFNGFGYIGSTVFALPGVKGAIPNGRNEDGTLKNTPMQTNVVRTTKLSSFSGDRILLSNIVGGLGILYDLTSTLGGYNYETNLIYRGSGAVITGQAEVGKVVMSNGVITSFQTKTPFHVVDYNDFAPVKDAIPTKQDIATAVNYDNITNCITEIPQDIKLELNNGTLRLKAGSKVYVPNGPGKFDVVTVPNNVSSSNPVIIRESSTIVYRNNSLSIYLKRDTFSGATQPTPSGNNAIWYDTANNYVKYTDDKGANWKIAQISLPICLASSTATKWTSIDQVFNGFGYIGSTAFALPGVKVLIPNGRNADGTLKNIEFVINNVITRTITWNNSAGQELFIGKYNLNDGIQFISTSSVGQYYKQEAEPSLILYAIWYKPAENKVYICDKDSNGNLIWKDNFPCYIGQWFTSATSPYPITKLTIGLPFHAVDWNDSSWLSGLGMPSNKYINLTLGASGSTYTAPANGWFVISGKPTADGGYCILDTNNYKPTYMTTNMNGWYDKGFIPVLKGQVMTLRYGNYEIEADKFKFIYAQGEL